MAGAGASPKNTAFTALMGACWGVFGACSIDKNWERVATALQAEGCSYFAAVHWGMACKNAKFLSRLSCSPIDLLAHHGPHSISLLLRIAKGTH